MNVFDTIHEALQLLFAGDTKLWNIIAISFSVSVKAIIITIPLALMVAFALAYTHFPGKKLILSGFNTMLAIPAVVIGLVLYILLSRSGPLGDWRLLFTQSAMMYGQAILALPILVVMSHSSLQSADRRLWETAMTLGAPVWRAVLTLFHEMRFGLMAAVIAGFGRIIAEVGCSMMVGGNILNYTRNIPTAIALETSKGEFAQGIALGFVLLVLALGLNFGLTFFQGRGEMA